MKDKEKMTIDSDLITKLRSMSIEERYIFKQLLDEKEILYINFTPSEYEKQQPYHKILKPYQILACKLHNVYLKTSNSGDSMWYCINCEHVYYITFMANIKAEKEKKEKEINDRKIDKYNDKKTKLKLHKEAKAAEWKKLLAIEKSMKEMDIELEGF